MILEAHVSAIAELLTAATATRYPEADRDECSATFARQIRKWQPVEVRTLGDLRAAVVLTEPVDARWGAPEAWLHVAIDSTSEAVDWVTQQLDELRPGLPASASCRIPAEWRALLPAIRAVGFGVSKLGLGGQVETMHARLATLDLVDPTSLGLVVRQAVTLDDVRASSALRRDYFTRHPEHGWASRTLTDEQQAAIDQRVEAEMLTRLDAGAGLDWVVAAEGRVLGCFGLLSPYDSPVIGRGSSFNICLGPEIQRRGLGTLAYRIMIERGRELGVEHIAGMTSNPGVIEIANKIGRRVDNWLLRKATPWLPDAAWHI